MREVLAAAKAEIGRVLVSESDGRLHATQHGQADGKVGGLREKERLVFGGERGSGCGDGKRIGRSCRSGECRGDGSEGGG